MNGQTLMEITRSNIKLVELDFFDKECKKCIGTHLQKKRQCSKISGYYLGCKTMHNFIKEKTKTENNKNFSEFFNEFKESI